MLNIISGTASEQMLEGIKEVSQPLRPTYGGAGTNFIIESKLKPLHLVVNDAETIVQSIKVTNAPAQKIGVDFIKELCSEQDKTAGNGRKTTIFMGETILEEGIKAIKNKEITPKKLKESLDEQIPVIEKLIDTKTRQISLNEVESVATTASEIESIGKVFQEIYSQIGKNGILNIEGSKTYDTTYFVTNGVRFEMTGMLSPEMVFDEEAKKDNRPETKAIYHKPHILVTKRKITTDEDIDPLIREIANSESESKSLVIFTNDMDSSVASRLVSLHQAGGFNDKYGNFKRINILIIKAPVLWQDGVFDDFAACTGATIICDANGKNFKNIKLEDLGTCDTIEADNEDTVLTGIKDITEHCNRLLKKGDEESMLRLSWLASKSAVLKLGANSPSDLSYKRLKANDANRSTYLALQYGVVKGGAVSLYDVANELEGDSTAVNILRKALKDPLIQASKNYGVSEEEYKEIITDNIVDASMVIKRAVRNAIGIASTIITAPSLTYIPPLTPEEMAYQVAMRQNNPFNQ